jgi:hypothetical protein
MQSVHLICAILLSSASTSHESTMDYDWESPQQIYWKVQTEFNSGHTKLTVCHRSGLGTSRQLGTMSLFLFSLSSYPCSSAFLPLVIHRHLGAREAQDHSIQIHSHNRFHRGMSNNLNLKRISIPCQSSRH